MSSHTYDHYLLALMFHSHHRTRQLSQHINTNINYTYHTHNDRYFLERTQQLCTKVGLLCDTLSFVPPTTSSTSTSHKHVIDLELLPDEWDDEFLQPQAIGTATPIDSTTSTSRSIQHKNRKQHKKHVKIKTSRNTTYYIPSISNKHIQPKIPAPSSPSPLHYYTATPTITFAEWEKIPVHDHSTLPYTFCIQCEKPIKHQYSYDHHIQAHVQKQSTPTTTTTATTTTPTTDTTTTTSATTTTTSTTKPTKAKKPSKATYICPYSGCQHKFNPNTSHFVRDLNAHIDSYHDDTFLYDY